MQVSKWNAELLAGLVLLAGAWSASAQPLRVMDCDSYYWGQAYCQADGQCEQTQPENPNGCMEAEVTHCFVWEGTVYFDADCWELEPEFCPMPPAQFCE